MSTIPSSEIKCSVSLGKGGFGEVWKATWSGQGGGEIVAVKKIPISGANEKAIETVLKEVDILSKLKHPNILTIFGKSIVPNELWIILKYMDGGDLYSYLQSTAIIDWDTRLKLAIQATKAVNYLHSQDSPILHRDIKSLNFLVSKSGGLKLTDFGMAKAKSMASASGSVFGVGTYRWSAPEVLATPEPNWTEKADIFYF